MLHLELVSTAQDEATRTYEGDMLHGTAVLRHTMEPWPGTNRIVCADSYFASVEAADEMAKIGLRFIGLVKTSTTRFPLQYLSSVEFTQRGKWHSVMRKNGDGFRIF